MRTDGQTYTRTKCTDGQTLETCFIRSTLLKNRPIKVKNYYSRSSKQKLNNIHIYIVIMLNIG